uniref:Odorant-binding protein 15 n=2 Tax=Meteorus pulchricornis TaxID=51522 RepID=A0A1S5VFI2_9HYME|nr:odorant-binding protein 15 [Meteorus pulchricornis]
MGLIPCSICLITFVFLAINIHNSEAKMTLPQVRNALKPGAKTCMTKTGVSKSLVEKTHEGEFPTDPALQCYFACILKLMKVVSKDEHIDLDMMHKQADLLMVQNLANQVKQLTQTCYENITSSEVCEMSWELVKCYHELDSSMYFFP